MFLKMGARILWALPVACVLLLAADSSWQDKPISQWSKDDIRQILDDSPWGKTVKAGITRLQSEDQRREAGAMGQDHGVGFDGVGGQTIRPANVGDVFRGAYGPVPTTGQFITLKVRWETALPLRAAELKSGGLEISPDDGYTIAVYGVPGTYFKGDPKKLGDPLKKDAVLRREGKKDVKPSRVEVFQREEGAVVVYVFPLSTEITKKDRRVEFSAQIGRLILDPSFNLEEMQFQGKLEL